jgi:hypothetical protein
MERPALVAANEALRQQHSLAAGNVDVKPYCAGEALCWERVIE